MPEPSQYTFTFKELAEMMVREVGVREGFWGLQVKFGIGAVNAGMTAEELRPTAIVPLVELGLQRFENLTSLSVDAAEVWKKRDIGPVSGATSEEGQPKAARRRASAVKA